MYTEYEPRKREVETFDLTIRRPKELTPLTAEDITYLETSRPIFEAMQRSGTVKNLLLDGLFLVMLNSFDINYPKPDGLLWNSVLKFLKDLYQHYDKWLLDNPKTT